MQVCIWRGERASVCSDACSAQRKLLSSLRLYPAPVTPGLERLGLQELHAPGLTRNGKPRVCSADLKRSRCLGAAIPILALWLRAQAVCALSSNRRLLKADRRDDRMSLASSDGAHNTKIFNVAFLRGWGGKAAIRCTPIILPTKERPDVLPELNLGLLRVWEGREEKGPTDQKGKYLFYSSETRCLPRNPLPIPCLLY